MDYTIIDAHAHLWLRQDTVVDGFPIRTLDNGRSLFMGEIRQMVPPFMMDGVNSAEVFLSNMNYAQVAAAVITQEFIDGIQNEYLAEVISRYPEYLLLCLAQGSEGCYIIIFCVMIFNQFESATRF